MGKNSLMKRSTIHDSEKTGNKAFLNLVPLLVGNVALIFTNGELREVSERIAKYKVEIPPESSLITIPDEIYREACVYTTEEAIASCQVIGYPPMIKASWGGGGKGIRKVHNADEVKALFKQVQGEVPGSPIFIMKVASQLKDVCSSDYCGTLDSNSSQCIKWGIIFPKKRIGS